MGTSPSVLIPTACDLGESPMWHSQRQSCFWVDIEGKKMFEYKWLEKKTQHWQMPERISMIAEGKNNKLILGLQGGIYKFDLDYANLSLITDLNENWKDLRCNDGAFDSVGRLWIGIMHLDYTKGNGSVYCIGKNGTYQKKIMQVAISNGIAWSADNTRMYYTDSLTREIWSYLFNEETGEIIFEKVVITIPGKLGLPDGIAMDNEGCLWIAIWGGWGVGRWDVDKGEMIDFINVPAPFVTSCAFVGENLDHLLITTAKQGMDEKSLATYPQSGCVFIAEPGVKGLPVYSGNL